LKLDETLAEAHASLGKAKLLYDWDWAGAEQELKRAIELNPNSAEAHSAYSVCLTSTGRLEEAVAEARRGQELDPLSPFVNFRFALRLYFARQYDEAIEELRKMLEIDPSAWRAHRYLSTIYLVKGMNDEAVAEFETADRLSGSDPKLRAAQTKAYQAGGIRGYLQKRLEQMNEPAKRRFESHTSIAFESGAPLALDFADIYAYLGEKDQALEWLQKAYEEHNNGLIRLKTDPIYDSLRSDPRFTYLLRRIGLAP
jgi:tetratricopeptide (TPR) repeat protein